MSEHWVLLFTKMRQTQQPTTFTSREQIRQLFTVSDIAVNKCLVCKEQWLKCASECQQATAYLFWWQKVDCPMLLQTHTFQWAHMSSSADVVNKVGNGCPIYASKDLRARLSSTWHLIWNALLKTIMNVKHKVNVHTTPQTLLIQLTSL